MRKLGILLKKEIRELLTLQLILPLIITAVLFVFIGKTISSEQKKTAGDTKVTVIDQDESAFSKQTLKLLDQSNLELDQLGKLPINDGLGIARDKKSSALIVFPSGFEKSLENGTRSKIEVYTRINSFSALSGQSYANLVAAISLANESISRALILQENPTSNPDYLKQPIVPDEFIVVGDKQANISPNLVMSFVYQQTMFIPIILFVVIIFAAQMVATAIANEKENKTLETLLTAPVSRTSIVIAKMAAAAVIALIASVVYMFSFKSYLSGMTSLSGGSSTMTEAVANAISQLGLTLSATDYVLIGISLFASILVALAMALILGAFAEDVKSVAGVTSPLMIVVMIPYFLTLFLDINTLSAGLRNLAYVIPFSHVFLAAPNLYLDNYNGVLIGIVYQLFWFAIFVFIAAKIFSTDKIMTMKLNFSKKKTIPQK